jgi:hypothetical protein
MTPTRGKRGKRYRYYVSNALITGTRSGLSTGRRVPAGDIEGLVLDRLRALFASDVEVSDALASIDLDAPTGNAPARQIRARQVVEDEKSCCLKLSHAVRLTNETLTVQRRTEPEAAPIEMPITARLRRVGQGIRLVIGNGTADGPDHRLVGLLRDAFTTREALLSGRDDSIDAMATRLGVSRLHLTSLFRLSYLAPQIIVRS